MGRKNEDRECSDVGPMKKDLGIQRPIRAKKATEVETHAGITSSNLILCCEIEGRGERTFSFPIGLRYKRLLFIWKEGQHIDFRKRMWKEDMEGIDRSWG